MLNKIGLSTFYGPSFLSDIAELSDDMLPYTKKYFEKMLNNEKKIIIKSSPVWYEDRKSYDISQLGILRKMHKEKHGFETINGSGVVSGILFGGCIDSIYDMFTGERYGDENSIFKKYNLLPTLEEWREKILFLETSEETPTVEKLKKILLEFKKRKILNNVKAIIVGKPLDEINYYEYKNVYKKIMNNISTPVMYNVNFGHSVPRCVLPYNALATIDFDKKTIIIESTILEK